MKTNGDVLLNSVDQLTPQHQQANLSKLLTCFIYSPRKPNVMGTNRQVVFTEGINLNRPNTSNRTNEIIVA